VSHFLVKQRCYIGDQLLEPGIIIDLTVAQSQDGKGQTLSALSATASAVTPWLPAPVYGAPHHPSQGG
jgi:hypothetical protein